MNPHALGVLQYREALEIVAKRASSPLGAEALLGFTPLTVANEVSAELALVDQTQRFHTRIGWTPPAIPDVRAPLRRLALEGSVLEGGALHQIGELVRSSDSAARALRQHRADFPELAAIGAGIGEHAPLERTITHAIDEAGDVRDGASRELGQLRREIRGARSRIVQQLEKYMGTLPDRYRVADASVSVREGRYVIPVRREARGEVGGLVHDESATGQTLFVEPPIAIELMNRLRELEMAESREVLRIMREVTDTLRPHQQSLATNLDLLVRVDTLYARARFAAEFDGMMPEMMPGSRTYRVVNGRHPILLATSADVVPFDLVLEADEQTLLVSGPNTGGKTVFLKAVGLLSLLAQSGVIPPVGAGTQLPLFRDVFADIGDEQSIEASLSTFSAHLKNLREIIEGADAGALVLIDEIGSGTDPAEGAALAHAILVELTQRGALTVATTHLGQLKSLAGEEPGVVNASLQFDSRELRPTYRLVKGLPGRSYGLAIARRLGFPEWLMTRAEALVPEAERDATALLQELDEKERALSGALQRAASAQAETDELGAALEQREVELRKREREAERRARQQARDLLLTAREEVDTAIRELRSAAMDGAAALDDAARAARRSVEEAARKQNERTPAEEAHDRASASRVAVGMRVRVMSTGAKGTVTELRDGRAVVETSGARLQVPVSGLEPIAEQAQPAVRAGSGWSAPEVNASPEVDLRGLRADEVASQLEPALDAALRADLQSLRIIHGKGTGALRSVVADVLKRHPNVRTYRLGQFGEGGSGVTVAELA